MLLVVGCEFNVVICIVEFDIVGNVVLGVGGGIIVDFDLDVEWVECLYKVVFIVGLLVVMCIILVWLVSKVW